MPICNQLRCTVEIEPVRLDDATAEFFSVNEVLTAGSCVEGARGKKAAERRIDCMGMVAAMPQRRGQAALHPAGGDAGHEEPESAVGTCRQAAQDVIFREPAWAAGALNQQLAGFAVE